MLRDRLFKQSDPYHAYVCDTCHFLAEPPAPPDIVSALHSRPYCRHCKSNDNIFRVEMPYACKLLLQELMALHIMPKINLV